MNQAIHEGTLFHLRGDQVEFIAKRCSDVNRRDDHYYYELRHPDGDVTTPTTIEARVSVNFFGTLISVRAILNGNFDIIKLRRDEIDILRYL